MKILHLSQYFPPEAGAVQVRAMTIARTLAENGHQVSVLTEVPNHPSGIIQPAYRGKLWIHETREGVDVWHLWVKTSPKKNFRTRLVFYLSYMFAAIVAGLLLPGKFDVVFANSPPLFVAAAGWIISVIRRVPFVMEVQDLWPESAVVMGELNNPRYIRWAEWVEERCYQRAVRVVAVTQGIYDRLAARGVPESKIVLVSNGSNTDIFQPNPAGGNRLRDELGFRNKFVVLYGGIFGLAQGLEIVIEAAELLREYPEVQLIFVGEGPKKDELQALKETYKLPNLLILPGQALEDMPAYLSMADIALAPLRKLDLFLGARPTKIFDAWACQTPTLINIDGEARQVLEEVGAGIFVEPEDPQALANAVLKLKDQPDKLAQMGLAGYQVAQKKYSLQAAAKEIEIVFQKVAANS